MIYVCVDCDKTFDRKSNYETHLNRKNPCILKTITMSKLEKETNEKLEAQQNKTNELLKKIDDLSEKMEQLLAITKNEQIS